MSKTNLVLVESTVYDNITEANGRQEVLNALREQAAELERYETARQEDARRLEQVTAEREAIESQLAKILVGVYIHQNDFTSEEANMTAALFWENWSDVKAAALKGGKG